MSTDIAPPRPAHDLVESLRQPTRDLRAAIPDTWDGFSRMHRSAVGSTQVVTRVARALTIPNVSSGARTRSCWSTTASTSSTTEVSTSPRSRPSRPGTWGTRASDSRARRSASIRSAASCDTSRSA